MKLYQLENFVYCEQVIIRGVDRSLSRIHSDNYNEWYKGSFSAIPLSIAVYPIMTQGINVINGWLIIDVDITGYGDDNND